MDKYCVVGNPISHSLSPYIHEHFAKQTQHSLVYTKQFVSLEPNAFDVAMRSFFSESEKGKGCNITVPFKEQAFLFADRLTDRAKSAQAVNTLALLNDGSILGDNTDGAGLVADLLSKNVSLKGKNIVILGAGGAVRGVIQPLLQQLPLSITIVNRTLSKAQSLVSDFSDERVVACEWQNLENRSVDILINGTSAGLSNNALSLPSNWLTKQTVVYDMLYGEKSLPFQSWALEQGCTTLFDGLGMLVQQAAESFHLWRCIRPQTDIILLQLKQRMNP